MWLSHQKWLWSYWKYDGLSSSKCPFIIFWHIQCQCVAGQILHLLCSLFASQRHFSFAAGNKGYADFISTAHIHSTFIRGAVQRGTLGHYETAHSGIIVPVFHSAVIHRPILLVLLRWVWRWEEGGGVPETPPLFYSAAPGSRSRLSTRDSSAADVFKCDRPGAISHNYLSLAIPLAPQSHTSRQAIAEGDQRTGLQRLSAQICWALGHLNLNNTKLSFI